jgi:hypothetical protein
MKEKIGIRIAVDSLALDNAITEFIHAMEKAQSAMIEFARVTERVQSRIHYRRRALVLTLFILTTAIGGAS